MAPPGHGAMLVLVSAPLVFMAAGSDLARLVPWFDAFLAATALGHMVGFALAIVVLGVLLPLLFRCCMPVTTQLPARVAAACCRSISGHCSSTASRLFRRWAWSSRLSVAPSPDASASSISWCSRTAWSHLSRLKLDRKRRFWIRVLTLS